MPAATSNPPPTRDERGQLAHEPTAPADDSFACGAVIPRASPVLQFATALRVEQEQRDVEAFGKTVAVTTGDVLAEIPVPSSRARRELPVISRLVHRTMMDAARRIERRPRLWIGASAGLATVLMLGGIGGGGWLASRWLHGSGPIGEPAAGAVLTATTPLPEGAPVPAPPTVATAAAPAKAPDPAPAPAPEAEKTFLASTAAPPAAAQAKAAPKAASKPAPPKPAAAKSTTANRDAGRAPAGHAVAHAATGATGSTGSTGSTGKPDAKVAAAAGAGVGAGHTGHTTKAGAQHGRADAGAHTGHAAPADAKDAKKAKKGATKGASARPQTRT